MIKRCDQMTLDEAIQPINYMNLRDILVIFRELVEKIDEVEKKL